MIVPFDKAHGAGNDFAILRLFQLQLDWPKFARWACDRHLALGADGIVGISRGPDLTFEVICYNADGSMATMCGNALRCVARSIELNYGLKSMTLRMCGRIHKAEIHQDGRIGITVQHDEAPSAVESIRVNALQFEFYSMYTGTEHVVAFVDNIDSLDISEIGRQVRSHPAYGSVGTNVNFAQIDDDERLYVRTYERGVEGETLSCGSGAVATALVARRLGKVSGGRIDISNRSGHALSVHLEPIGAQEAWLVGPAEIVYSGECTWED